MAITKRADGKFVVTCRNESGGSVYAVRDTPEEAEGFFILNARLKSCGAIPSLSFAGLCVWHRLERERAGIKTAKAIYRNCLHAVAYFGDVPIRDVHLGHLSRARTSMIKNGYSQATANNVFNRVRTLFHYAHCAGRISVNTVSPEKGQPLGNVVARRHASGTKRRPVKTPVELNFNLLREVAPPHLRAILDLIDDWVHFSELIALESSSVNLEGRSVLINRAFSKQGVIEYPPAKWRLLSLSPKTVTSIRRFLFELERMAAEPTPGREHLLFPFALKPSCLASLAHLHAIQGEFSPEQAYNRTVVRAIAAGMTSFEISQRAGRSPNSIGARFHVAFRRRAARALLVPLNTNLKRLLA